MNRSSVPGVFCAICATALMLMGSAPAARNGPTPPALTPDRVHFDLQGLAKQMTGEARPAIPLPPEPEPGLGAEPANVRFRFDGDRLAGFVTAAERQVVVYPAPAFRELFVKAGEGKGEPGGRPGRAAEERDTRGEG